MRYTPYGEIRYGDAPTDRRFTGQRHEAGLGLYDYGARYYDPTLGRFIQADTIAPSPANPQSLNRYAYTLNNPLRYTDPTGHAYWKGEDGGYHWLNPYARPKPTLQGNSTPSAAATLGGSTQQSVSTRPSYSPLCYSSWTPDMAGARRSSLAGGSDTVTLQYARGGGYVDGFVEGGVHTGGSVLGIATYNHEWQYRRTFPIWRDHRPTFDSSYTVTGGALFMATEASLSLNSGELSTAAGVDIPTGVGEIEYRQNSERINELSYGGEAPLAGPTGSVGVIWQTPEKVVLQTTRYALCVAGGTDRFSARYGPGGMTLTGYTVVP